MWKIPNCSIRCGSAVADADTIQVKIRDVDVVIEQKLC